MNEFNRLWTTAMDDAMDVLDAMSDTELERAMMPLEDEDFDPTARYDDMLERFNRSLFKLKRWGLKSQVYVEYWQPGDKALTMRLAVQDEDGGRSAISEWLTDQGMADYLYTYGTQNGVDMGGQS